LACSDYACNSLEKVFLDGSEKKPAKTIQKKVVEAVIDEHNPAYVL
jgi:hypothetical protein